MLIAQSVTTPPLIGGGFAVGRTSQRVRGRNVSRAAVCRESSRRALLWGAASVPFLSLIHAPPAGADAGTSASATGDQSAYSFVLQQNGKAFPLSYLQGKVTVFVNVASE